MATRAISNTEDKLNTEDLRKYAEELEGTEDPDELEELKALTDLLEQIGDEDGELIRDSCFVEYAQELAEETGALPEKLSWPLYNIDWQAAARDLQMDYTAVEFAGVTYWFREY
jgi:antirestriction protein